MPFLIVAGGGGHLSEWLESYLIIFICICVLTLSQFWRYLHAFCFLTKFFAFLLGGHSLSLTLSLPQLVSMLENTTFDCFISLVIMGFGRCPASGCIAWDGGGLILDPYTGLSYWA